MRIVWAQFPRNISVGIAAQIFVYAGVILLFIANLFFAQRIVRAQHPRFGWSTPFSIALPILIAIIILTILALIAAVIVQFYVFNGEITALDIQKFGSTLFAFVAFLPIPVVTASALARLHPHIKKTKTIDKFGEGTMRAKIAIVLISAFFLTLGAAFRAATTLLGPIPARAGSPPRPAPQPAFLSKAAFYVFNFGIEIGITLFWLAIRIDKRFYVPDGAKGPGSYAGGFVFAGEAGNEKSRSTKHLISARSSMHSKAGTDGTSTPYGRGSFASSRAKSIESRISWGGVSRENVAVQYGEDGVATIPYSAFEDQPEDADVADMGLTGQEKEMGWDPKSGKWALRPISRRMSLGPRERPVTDEHEKEIGMTPAGGDGSVRNSTMSSPQAGGSGGVTPAGSGHWNGQPRGSGTVTPAGSGHWSGQDDGHERREG